MVGVLASGSSCPGLSPSQGHCVVFLGKTLALTVTCLSPPKCRNGYPANLILGVTLQWSLNATVNTTYRGFRFGVS